MQKKMYGLTPQEFRALCALDTPSKIQDYLNKLPFNFEEKGETCMSPRRVLREKKAHCLEGALFAAGALLLQGKDPLLMDLSTTESDVDHVVTLFRSRGYWGAISKTNHAVLRYREPIYKTPRELAMSYFHEYFLNDGKKTLRRFSKPFNLLRYKDKAWLTDEENLWYISDDLDGSPHEDVVPRPTLRLLRRADTVEIEAGKVVEFKPPKKKPK